MDDSSMDLTDVVINSSRDINKTLLSTQEKNEALFQENYELKKKIEILQQVTGEMESELSFVTSAKLEEKSKHSKLQAELNLAHSKIKQLSAELEDEKNQVQNLMQELEDTKTRPNQVSTVVVPDVDQLNNLTGQIINLQALRDKDEILKKQVLEEMSQLSSRIKSQKVETEELKAELDEVKELLKLKTEDNCTLNENLETLREDKLILSAELQMLKSSNNSDSRGNSLFAEVEENRQKAVGQRELLKIKYLNLKKILSQKQAENNKLKLQIVQIRREDKEDEKTIHQDYYTLIETLKERISELEGESISFKQKLEKHPVVLKDGDLQNFQLINSIAEGARKESDDLQRELDRRGSHYVVQGHQLFEAQKENRRLKTSNKKLLSDIEELKFKLDTIKLAQEPIEDGISPPATDIALQQQTKKLVKFRNVIYHNTSQAEEDKENKE